MYATKNHLIIFQLVTFKGCFNTSTVSLPQFDKRLFLEQLLMASEHPPTLNEQVIGGALPQDSPVCSLLVLDVAILVARVHVVHMIVPGL